MISTSRMFTKTENVARISEFWSLLLNAYKSSVCLCGIWKKKMIFFFKIPRFELPRVTRKQLSLSNMIFSMKQTKITYEIFMRGWRRIVTHWLCGGVALNNSRGNRLVKHAKITSSCFWFNEKVNYGYLISCSSNDRWSHFLIQDPRR